MLDIARCAKTPQIELRKTFGPHPASQTLVLCTMAPGEPPRALVLQHSDLQLVIGKLARACLSFQEAFLTKPKSPAGLLCQAWIPDVVEDNQIVLKTKNMPFCVAGMGDLLALFRCISCRFAFGTNVAKPATLGAPGRVYTSSEPEMCCNVQQYAKGAYLRKAEAEQCQVQSTLLLPLFISPRRTGCVGVLEVVQTSEDMAFADVATLLSDSLERCDLFTCSMDEVRQHAPHAARRLTSVLLPPQTGVLVPPETSSEPAGSNDGGASDGGKPGGGAAVQEDAQGGRGADSEDFSADEDDEDGSDGEGRRGGKSVRGGASSQRSRRRAGNPGKPGVRLTLADLQSHFGVGLKEAAARLGICPTTLKRACRRHGIQRWPRRQLQKVNRALDELEARQMLQTTQQAVAGAPPAHAAPMDAYGGLADPAADSRWTTLAQFIPAYHNNMSGQLGGSGLVGNGLAGSGLFGSMYVQQEQQLQQGLLPYATPQLPGMQAQQAQQQMLAQQVQQAALQQQALAAGQQRQHQAPAPSHASLPDGALAMGAGTGAPTGGIIEVSAVSGVSTLGQPPPQVQQGAQQQGAQQQQQQQRRSFDSFAQPAGTTAAGPAQQQSATSSGGAPRSAQYLQRVAASTHFVSPFLPSNGLGGGAMAAPIVQLPAGLGANTVNLSAISVPSLPADVMPSLALASGRAGPAGGTQQNGGGGVNGQGGPPDDDQVGFLDSSVLELLLSEEQRGGLPRLGAQGQQNGVGGGAPATSVSVGELLPSNMAMPGISNGGVSGLSFML
ncbi:hypothetical protein ABPG77_004492 [Micractinium sp. CCAP 211/92]